MATTRTSSCSTWLTMVQAVARGMRTVVRLAMDSHLRSMLRLSLSVLVRDLSEGRPDCRRLAPAVFKSSRVRRPPPHSLVQHPRVQRRAGRAHQMNRACVHDRTRQCQLVGFLRTCESFC